MKPYYKETVMPEELESVDFLQQAHAYHEAAAKVLTMLDDKLRTIPEDQDTVEVKVEGLQLARVMIESQDNAIRAMVEHQLGINDLAEQALAKLKE